MHGCGRDKEKKRERFFFLKLKEDLYLQRTSKTLSGTEMAGIYFSKVTDCI